MKTILKPCVSLWQAIVALLLLRLHQKWIHGHRKISTNTKLHWLPHERPPYCPDLCPCDYHLFGSLKEAFRGESLSFLRVEFLMWMKWVSPGSKSQQKFWRQKTKANGVRNILRKRAKCDNGMRCKCFRTVRLPYIYIPESTMNLQ